MHPFLHLSGTYFIPTYILIISFTYCLCLVWAHRRAVQHGRSSNMTLDISLAVMIGGFIGARFMHVLYESPEIYIETPSRIFKFWEGGFVFYGGFIGALIASAVFLRSKRESFLDWADFFAPVLALGYALGRIACFMNGCCYGDLCDLPWAVEFNFPGLPVGARHPTQLYATVFELGTLSVLLFFEKRRTRMSFFKNAGSIFFTWLALHSMSRMIMEAFRDDYRGPAPGLSVSTWISIIILIVCLVMLFSKSLLNRSCQKA